MVAIIGNGEESDWEPMKAYAKAVPPPRFTISVDANFPLVIAESGFVEWHLLAPLERAQGRPCPEVVDVRGGEFLTQIPGEAAMTLRPSASQRVAELVALATALAREEQQTRGRPFRAEAKTAGELVIIRTFGASGHSSVPEQSANALWPLSRIASRLDVCAGGAGTLLRLIAAELDGDHFGERLKLGQSDPLLGRLVQAPTVLRLEQGAARLEINLRRPGGMSHEAFEQRLNQVTAALGGKYGVREDVAKRHLGDPHVAELEGPLVSTLLDIYRREKGDPGARPTVIRGGTYGRLFPGAVSFGPGLPGAPYRGHAADEAIELSTLRFQAQVLFEARAPPGPPHPRTLIGYSPPAEGVVIPVGTDKPGGGAQGALHERIEARLTPLLGPFTAKMAIKTFAGAKLGLQPEQLTRPHIPALLDALRPMLNTLAGAAKAQAVLEELRKELA